MRIRSRLVGIALVVSAVGAAIAAVPSASTQPAASAPVMSDGNGAFATGKYRNLFAEMGHPQAEIDAKLNKAYDQLFHGDPNNQAIYYEAGKNDDGPVAYIRDIGSRDIRTEGLSYGMMMSVQMNKKAEFDAIWNWSRTYLYYTDISNPNYGYFAWTAQPTGQHATSGPAPDGESYYAMALYFAANRWPGGKGIYDYKACADRLITEMLHRTPAPPPATQTASQPASQPAFGRGGRGGGPRGNMFEPNYKMVRFAPGANNTDPSYHLPAFYELWARWGPPADRDFWLQAAAASRDLFVKVANPETGLCPDQCSFDGNPGRSQFQADAWRCVANWSMDWNWFAKDPRQQELSNHIQATFASKGMDTYPEKLSLDGKNVISNRHVIGVVAENAVGSLAATDPRSKDFVEALWNTPIPDGGDRYYSGCLYIMSFLNCSGQYRIWMPKQ